MRIVVFLLVFLVVVPVWADKLDELGLDPSGYPWPEKSKTVVASIVLELDGRLVRIARPGIDEITDAHDRASTIVRSILSGPTNEERSAGFSSVFPAGSRLEEFDSDGGHYVVRIVVPKAFLNDPSAVEGRGESMERALQDSLDGPGFVSFEMRVWDHTTEQWAPISKFLPPNPHALYRTSDDEATPGGQVPPAKVFPHLGSGRPSGALSGKDVYLNPGHGWVFRDSTTDYWGVQRGFVENNIEDFSNVDLVNQWIVAYCYNAGADVFSVRELDQQSNMVIVDNDDGAPAYVESGSGWFASGLAGFANGHMPYVNGEDPFSFGTNRLVACVEGSPTDWATWTAEIPEDGWYRVSVSHGAYTNRAPAAHYEIRHAGGTTDYDIDQRQRRFTWIPLGEYFFEAGSPASERQVVLYNDSSSASYYVSADAVRFGGGVGVISRGTAGTSGQPRFDEEARYNLQFSGAPDYDGTGTDEQDGWPRRPGFGRWLKQGAEAYGASPRDSVFISSHTNAGGGVGISSFVYPGYENTWHDRFRGVVHDEVVNDLINGYPGTYYDRGKKYGTYSENNPSNVSDLMPIFLGEWLFHDSASDMAMYHDPKFRRSLARAVYQGIVKFWAAENGSDSTLLPEPPQNLRVEQLDATRVRISWEAPLTDASDIVGDAATGFRLYRSTHGRAFPSGVDVGSGTSLTITDITPGTTEYIYVSASNAGGESFPTEVLAVRTTTEPNDPRLLIVSGFDKIDASTRVRDTWGADTLYRQQVRRMNTVDYVFEHASALAAASAGLSFDACEDEVISSGDISLDTYDAVIWIGGIQSEVYANDGSDDTSIDSAQQVALETYLAGGGRLFISGAEIAWDLDRGGGVSFIDTTLRANYVQDDSGIYTVSGSAGSIFAGIGPFDFGSGSTSSYAVHYPEVIEATGGSITAMEYGGGTVVEDFDDLSGWWDPNSSGQTNADAASTFSISGSPVHEGSASGDLYYVWGSGNFIREYNSDLTAIATGSIFSMWIYGDHNGHQLRICIRDQSDSDLFVSDYLTIDFSGWQQLTWNLASDPVNVWVQSGNGVLDGLEAGLDSIQVLRNGSGASSGHLYFDHATHSGGGSSGMAAATHYDGTGKVIFLGLPFETITDAQYRQQIMSAAVDFFDLFSAPPDLIFADGFETGDTSSWSQ